MMKIARLVVCIFFAIPSGPAHALTVPQPIVTTLVGYNLVFDEEFNEGSNFSAKLSEWGPISPPLRWIMHTPYAGDFGDAWFGAGTRPSSADSDGLNIRCYYNTTRAHWQSGLLSSADQKGSGFSQALGYWEAKVWCPPLSPADTANTPGLWPAFWLVGVNGISGTPHSGGETAEIDIMEAYSVNYTKYHTNWHVWNAGKEISAGGKTIDSKVDISQGWHVYSCLINADWMHFYFDGTEVFKAPTPAAAKLPLYVMVDFALGGGWPIKGLNKATTYHMQVAYVRCWAPAY
jgi:Glycosyl hydrolases family 16